MECAYCHIQTEYTRKTASPVNDLIFSHNYIDKMNIFLIKSVIFASKM